MKYCSNCGQTKSLSEFYKDCSKQDGCRSRCIECDRAYAKKVYTENHHASRQKQKKYARQHKKENKERFEKWKQENSERYKELQKSYRDNPNCKIAAKLARNLKIKWRDVGCSSEQFILKIQGKWEEGMDWENYRKFWDIEREVGGGFKIFRR